MAKAKTSDVALRISGDDLLPDEITAKLGASPTRSHIKGERGKHIVGPKTGDERVAISGMWVLEAIVREPEDMDSQIREILNQMTNDLSVWKFITQKYRVDLFCGLFLSGIDGGLTLSPESLAALGKRGIEFGLCIYADEKDAATHI